MLSVNGDGSMVCPLHGTRTRISCVKCGRPICPECATTSPVGLTCGEHPQRSIRFVHWMPARGPVRPVSPMWVFFVSLLALAAGARATVGFFFAIDTGRPWIGVALVIALAGAITLAFFYWLRRRS